MKYPPSPFRLDRVRWTCFRWPALVALVMALALQARAERIPLLPHPVTTPELIEYADLIGISDQQRLGLLPMHDAYKERFKQFEDRDVRKLIDEVIEIGMRFQKNRFAIPPRAELEGVIDDYKRLINQSNSIDRSLFEELATTLSEEQQLKLPRAKTARELAQYRQVFSEMVGELNPGTRVNFGNIIRNMNLSPKEAQEADLILAEYEPALLARSREIYDAVFEAIKVILDVIDQLGLRDMTPDKMMALAQDTPTIETLKNTFDEASKPMQATAHSVSQLNFRTHKRLAGVLSPESAADLRHRYYDIAYDDIYNGHPRWRQRYTTALELEGVAEDAKKEIQIQRDNFDSQEDAMVDSTVTALEAGREYRNFAHFEHSGPMPIPEKRDELRKRMETLNSTADTTLEALIGPEHFAKLDQERNKGEGHDGAVAEGSSSEAEHSTEVSVGARPVGESGGGGVSVRVTSSSVAENVNLPSPMAIADLNRMCDTIGWAADDRAVITTMYDEYRQAYDALRSTPLATAEADASGETAAPPTAQASPAIAAGAEAKALRQRIDDLNQLDTRFFDDAAIIVSAEHYKTIVQWCGQVRSRQTANILAKSVGSIYGEYESFADPVFSLLGAPLDETTVGGIRSAVEEYQSVAAPLVVRRLDQARDAQKQMARMQAAWSQPDGGNREAAKLAQEKWGKATRDVQGTNRELVELNRRILDDLNSRLPQAMTWQFKNSYYRAAYPDVFEDHESAEPAITGVLEMAELSPQQREAVSRINDQYHVDYFELCDQMITLRRQRKAFSGDFEAPSKGEIDREIELEQLRFQREEVNSRAKLQLRMNVPSELAQRLPGLRTSAGDE